MTATDALWNLQYLALSFGSDIVEGNVDVLATESDITITQANTITVQGTPVDFAGLGTVGWYRRASEQDWHKITFVGQTATVEGLAVGTTVCVSYNSINSAARMITVYENMVPSEMHAILEQDLFLGEPGSEEGSSRVGKLVIDIPRYQLNVDQTLSMSASGTSTTNLSGNALVSYGGAGCDEEGYYGFIKEVVFDAKFYDDLVDLAIAGTNELQEGDFIVVRGIKSNGMSKIIAPENITYTVEPSGNATIDTATGEITGVTNECVVTVKLKDGSETIPAPYNTLEDNAAIIVA